MLNVTTLHWAQQKQCYGVMSVIFVVTFFLFSLVTSGHRTNNGRERKARAKVRAKARAS